MVRLSRESVNNRTPLLMVWFPPALAVGGHPIIYDKFKDVDGVLSKADDL